MTGHLNTYFYGVNSLSKQLSNLYAKIATYSGVKFFDAGDVIVTSPINGVHLKKKITKLKDWHLQKKL